MGVFGSPELRQNLGIAEDLDVKIGEVVGETTSASIWIAT